MSNDINHIRLTDCLAGLLSMDSTIRSTAEHYLSQMEQLTGFGLRLLSEVILQPTVAVQLRQLALIVLKNFIKSHWSPQSIYFTPPLVPPAEKAQIKASASAILRSEDPKLRTAAAMVVTGIMHWEWPAEWPTAFQELVQCLRSPDPRLLRGAIACLDMFVSSEALGEETAPGVVELLLPELLRIFMSAEEAAGGGSWVRLRVVSIFMSCVQLLSFGAGLNDKKVGAIFGTNLPSWVAAFAALLSRKDAPTSAAHVGICTSVVRSLNVIMVSYPQYIAPYVPQLLSRIWTCFAQTYAHYQSIEVYGEKNKMGGNEKCLPEQTSKMGPMTSPEKTQDPAAKKPDDKGGNSISNGVDDDDHELASVSDTPTLPALVAALLDFLTLVAERPRLRGTVQPLLSSLAQLTVGYLQVTAEQSEAWAASPELLAAADEDDGLAVNVRLAGRALLTLLARSFGPAGVRACWDAVDASLTQAAAMRRDGNPHWWRLREAALTGLCAIAPALTSTRRGPADISALANTLLTQDVSIISNIFNTSNNINAINNNMNVNINSNELGPSLLAGRAICAAAELSWRLPEAGSLQFVRAIAGVLGDPRSPSLCICAARAALVFYQSLPPVALAPYMPAILRGLARLVAGTVEDALSLFLYVLGTSIRVVPEAAAEAQTLATVTAALLDAMGRNPSDTILADDVAQTFAQLLRIPGTFEGVAQHLLPALSQILLAGEALEGLALVALGMLRAALAAFSANYLPPPPQTPAATAVTSQGSDNCPCPPVAAAAVPVQVKQAFSALGRFIANYACDAVDMDFMRSAIDVMRLFFLTFGEGILNWGDDVITFIFSVFAPVFATTTTTQVPDCRTMLAAPALCDFLHYSARAARPLGPALLPLLDDVTRRTLCTGDAYAAAAYVAIFAHVGVLDAAGLVAFLGKSDVSGTSPMSHDRNSEKSLLRALMERWLESVPLLRASGLYQVKVSALALENILLLRSPLVEQEAVTSAGDVMPLPAAILSHLCEVYREVDWESELCGGDKAGDVIQSVKKSSVQMTSPKRELSGSSAAVPSFEGLDGITEEIKSQYTVEALEDFDEDALVDEDEECGMGGYDDDDDDDGEEEVDLAFVGKRAIYKVDLKQQIEGFVAAAARKGLTGFFKSLYDVIPPKNKSTFEVIWNRSKKVANLI